MRVGAGCAGYSASPPTGGSLGILPRTSLEHVQAVGQIAAVLTAHFRRFRAAAGAAVRKVGWTAEEATRPLPLLTGLAAELTRSRKELLAEHALLRQHPHRCSPPARAPPAHEARTRADGGIGDDDPDLARERASREARHRAQVASPRSPTLLALAVSGSAPPRAAPGSGDDTAHSADGVGSGEPSASEVSCSSSASVSASALSENWSLGAA